jgi:AraC family transcriptional regulator, regulatory protein of adaptative response / methylated-DNA-[protein]-cysteine methyltransferase
MADEIVFTVVPSGIGPLGIAQSARGICAVYMANTEREAERALRARFPGATLTRDEKAIARARRAVLQGVSGETPDAMPLDLRGTGFQQQVWRALLEIPPGVTRSYAEIARRIGKPGSYRAVANACGANPVAILVPCHRVIASGGKIGGFGGGLDRKRALLAAEGALLGI